MFLMKVIQKIRFAFVIENEIFYINGSETLPPPLSKDEEQHIMQKIAKGDDKAREPLIVHNLGLWSILQRNLKLRMQVPKT